MERNSDYEEGKTLKTMTQRAYFRYENEEKLVI